MTLKLNNWIHLITTPIFIFEVQMIHHTKYTSQNCFHYPLTQHTVLLRTLQCRPAPVWRCQNVKEGLHPDTMKPRSRRHTLHRKDTCHSEIFPRKLKASNVSRSTATVNLSRRRRRAFSGENFPTVSINSLTTNQNNKESSGERKPTLARVQVNKWQGSSGQEETPTGLRQR